MKHAFLVEKGDSRVLLCSATGGGTHTEFLSSSEKRKNSMQFSTTKKVIPK